MGFFNNPVVCLKGNAMVSKVATASTNHFLLAGDDKTVTKLTMTS